MSDYREAPHVSLDNDDPSLRDDSVRAFLDAENDKAAALFAQIAETNDEHEQMQRYSDALVVVYRAGFLATRALLAARSIQVHKLLDVNDEAHQSLAKAREDPPRPSRSCSASGPRRSSRESRARPSSSMSAPPSRVRSVSSVTTPATSCVSSMSRTNRLRALHRRERPVTSRV